MKIISSFLFFVIFTAVSAQGNEGTVSQSSSIVTTAATSVTDKSTAESTTTTLESTSTTITSTTEPTIPVTSTATSRSMPSSSTAVSSTSEAPIPTSSTVTPTKAPEPKQCQFNVTDGNATCILADLQAEFIIDFEGKKYSVMLGCNASNFGSDCSSSNNTQTLILSESTYTLTMVFEKESSKVLVKNITFSYNLPEGPSGAVSNYSEDLFNVKAGHSYLCKSKFDVHLNNVTTMAVHEIHVQAFLEEGKTYGESEECEADEKVSDIVPIAVGVALAALIIIVLIAYLVGRRRSRQRGYQSV